ncbi:MAG: hypothetical protein AB202_03110 [Parcubacteria bacterium C7867-007]|nr:MAG: hypothetical protein AB202_03110 [Parcubacteria bacterium C7867-007]
MAQRKKKLLAEKVVPAYSAQLYSSTEGRQFFPDILQDAFGEKTITGFHRYERVLGALIPMEALLMLAGCDQEIDEGMKLRIKNAARNLLYS